MAKQSPTTEPTRYLRFPAVKARVSFSRMHIDRLEKAGKFPKRVRIGERTVAWVEQEINAWVEARINARQDNQDPIVVAERNGRAGSQVAA